jgi:dynein heavy chain, axonemal
MTPSFFFFFFILIYNFYPRGEELFALPLTEYPELVQTLREIKLADQLFTLYVDVLGTLSNWKSVLWSDVTKQIGT